MIYAIIPFKQGDELETKILDVDPRAYTGEAPKVYLVSVPDTTTLELSQRIGYGDNANVGTGIILSVSNYHGFASNDLWEWIEVRRNDK